jgi:two-component system chemotaxis response regulator CheY
LASLFYNVCTTHALLSRVKIAMARILVADDDPEIRELIISCLSLAGHEVIEAANGLEAVEAFRVHHPDLVIIDLVMPVQEGIETILELRREFPTILIAAMSGYGRTDGTSYLNCARELGADVILSKPFQMRELNGLVEKTLDALIIR